MDLDNHLKFKSSFKRSSFDKRPRFEYRFGIQLWAFFIFPKKGKKEENGMNERQIIMDLLKPKKKKLKEVRDGKTWWVLLAFFLAISALIMLLSGFEKVPDAEAAVQDGDRPRCAMGSTVPELGENHVEFAATWENGSPTGAYPFEFGDGSSVVLTGTTGGIQFSHDYAYEVGGIVTYTAGFTVTNELTTTVCHIEHWIVIDDRPELPTEHYEVYLPIATADAQPPQVDLDLVPNPHWMRVYLHAKWSNGADIWHRLEFGDGQGIDLFGPAGDHYYWHDYPWPGGVFTATLTVSNTVGVSVSTLVFDLVPGP